MSELVAPPVLSTPLPLLPCVQGMANAPLAEMMLPSIDEIIRAFAIDWWDLPTPLDGGSWGGGGGGKGH